MTNKYILTVKSDRYSARYHYDTLAGADQRARWEMDQDEGRRVLVRKPGYLIRTFVNHKVTL